MSATAMTCERLFVMSYLTGMLEEELSRSPNIWASMRTSFSVPTTRRGSFMFTGADEAQPTSSSRAGSRYFMGIPPGKTSP
jgi:hypothetical protein